MTYDVGHYITYKNNLYKYRPILLTVNVQFKSLPWYSDDNVLDIQGINVLL